MTPVLLALACLKSVQHELGKKMPATVSEARGLLLAVLPRRRWGSPSRRVAMGPRWTAAAIAWYEWQQKRKEVARQCHRTRWLRDHPGPG